MLQCGLPQRGMPQRGMPQRRMPQRGTPEVLSRARVETPPLAQKSECFDDDDPDAEMGGFRRAQEGEGEGEEEGERIWMGRCTLTAGCVKHSKHRGKCKVVDMEEVEYEVEEVLDERVVAPKARKGGKAPKHLPVEYFVKWKGWPIEDATWEPTSALKGCPEILRAWIAAKQEP